MRPSIKNLLNIQLDSEGQTVKPVNIAEEQQKNPYEDISGFQSDSNVIIDPNLTQTTEDIARTDIGNAYNSFKQGIDETDMGVNDYDITMSELIIAGHSKLLRQLPEDDPQVPELQQSIQIEQEKLNKAQESKDTNIQEIQSNPVSKEYQLKQMLIEGQGSEAGLWNKIEYSYPKGVGSSVSLLAPIMGAQLGTGIATTLMTPVVGEVAAPFVALGTAAMLITGGRHLETKAEVGGNVQKNKEILYQKFLEEHQGEEPNEDQLYDIIIQANQGREAAYWQNMALAIPDLATAALFIPELKLFGAGSKAGIAIDKAINYNKFTKIGTTAGKLLAVRESETYEEGVQYGIGERQTDFALGTGLYENEGIIKDFLTDSKETLTSMDWSPIPGTTLRGQGRYAEDKQFQTASDLGGALAFLTGGFQGIHSMVKDLNTYRKVNKQLQDDGVFNVDDKYFKLKDAILQQHLEAGTVHHLIEGVKSLVGQKNEQGQEIVTEEEARKEIDNIQVAFDNYQRINSKLDIQEKKGYFGFFKDNEEKIEVKEAIRQDLFHTSLQLVRDQKKLDELNTKRRSVKNSINNPILEDYNQLKDQIQKQKDLISKLENTEIFGKKQGIIYEKAVSNAQHKLGILENELEKEEKSLAETAYEGIIDKTESLTLEEQEYNTKIAAQEGLLQEQKDIYKELLKINDEKTLKAWYNKYKAKKVKNEETAQEIGKVIEKAKNNNPEAQKQDADNVKKETTASQQKPSEPIVTPGATSTETKVEKPVEPTQSTETIEKEVKTIEGILAIINEHGVNPNTASIVTMMKGQALVKKIISYDGESKTFKTDRGEVNEGLLKTITSAGMKVTVKFDIVKTNTKEDNKDTADVVEETGTDETQVLDDHNTDIENENKGKDEERNRKDNNNEESKSGKKRVKPNTLAYRSTEYRRSERRLSDVPITYIESAKYILKGTVLKIKLALEGIVRKSRDGEIQGADQLRLKDILFKLFDSIKADMKSNNRTFEESFNYLKDNNKEFESSFYDVRDNIAIDITDENGKFLTNMNLPNWFDKTTIAVTKEEEADGIDLKDKIDNFTNDNKRHRLVIIKGFLHDMQTNSINPSFSINTEVISKSIGTQSIKRDTEGKQIYSSLSELESKDKVGIVIHTDNAPIMVQGDKIATEGNGKKGAIYLVLPTPNGEQVYYRPRLKKISAIDDYLKEKNLPTITDSIIRALNLYNLPRESRVKGFNTKDDIEKYLKQFLFIHFGNKVFEEIQSALNTKNASGELKGDRGIFLFKDDQFQFGKSGLNTPKESGASLFNRANSIDGVTETKLRNILGNINLNIDRGTFDKNTKEKSIKLLDKDNAIIYLNKLEFLYNSLEVSIHEVKEGDETIYFEQPTVQYDDTPINESKLPKEKKEKVETKEEILSKIRAATKEGTIDNIVGGVNTIYAGENRNKTYRQVYDAELAALESKSTEENDFETTPNIVETVKVKKETREDDDFFALVGTTSSSSLDKLLIKGLSPEERKVITENLGWLFTKRLLQYRKENKPFNFDSILTSVKESLEKLIRIETNENELHNATKLQVILNGDNWNIHTEIYLKPYLSSLGVNLKSDQLEVDSNDENQSATEGIEETIEITDGVNERTTFESDDVFSTDPRNKMGTEMKLFLSGIVSGSRLIGMSKFKNPTQIYIELHQALADILPSEVEIGIERFIQAIEKRAQLGKPHLLKVVENLKKSPESFKNAFYTDMRQRAVNGKTVLFDKGRGLVLDSNDNSIERLIRTRWEDGFLDSTIVTNNESGDKIIDLDKWITLRDKIQKATTALDKLALLKEIGINEDIFQTITILSKNNVLQKYANEKDINAFVDKTVEAITSSINSYFEPGNDLPLNERLNKANPFGKQSVAFKQVAYLSEVQAIVDEDIISSNSYRRNDGKTIYGFNLPTSLTNLFVRLKNQDPKLIKELQEGVFSKDSTFLKRLSDSRFLDTLELGQFDTFKEEADEQGLTISDLSDRKFELARVLAFFNRSQKVSNDLEDNTLGTFIWPTPADSNTFPTLSAIKRTLKAELTDDGISFDEFEEVDGQKAYTPIYNDIRKLIKSEILRILHVKKTKEGKDDTGVYTKELDENGKETGYVIGERFIMFPYLNDHAELNNKLDYSGEVENVMNTRVRDLAFTAVKKWMDDEVQRVMDKWLELGITTTNSKDELIFLGIDNNYRAYATKHIFSRYDKPFDYDIAKYAARDYVMNYMITYGNIYQLFTGDPANSGKTNVKDAIIETTKRTIKDRGTFKQGMWGFFNKFLGKVIGNQYRVVYVNDLKDTFTDKQISAIGEIIGEKEAQAYKKLNATDAQEWITGQEHIDVMHSLGKLSDEKYEKLTEIMQDKNAKFSTEDLKLILGTDILSINKPIQVVHKNVNGLRKIVYIKSSSLPLIPQLIKNQELGKLYDEMVRSNVQRVVTVSAAKLGKENIQTIFDKDGTVLNNIDFTKAVDTLDREGFGIQQDIPYDPNKEKILEVSQVMKLLFEGLSEEKFPGVIDLKNEYISLHKELMIAGKESLFKELGVVIDNEGNPTIEDLTKLKDILHKDAIKQNYPLIDLSYLELTKDKKAFIFPIEYTSATKNIEALIASMFKNKIMKQKLSGQSSVQASEAGMMKVINYDSISKKSQKGIVYVPKGFNQHHGKGLLSFFTKEKRSIGVYINWNFKDNEGNLLDINDYIKDRELNLKKFSPAMLDIIGMRIPNQGHNSMANMKIEGFLPNWMGNTIVVPGGITIQMGSDFDVDKLYSYMYNYNVTNNGYIDKLNYNKENKENSREAIENRIIDIQKEVLDHPSVLEKILKPLGTGNMKEVGEEIEKLQGKSKEIPSLLSTITQDNVRKTNKDGKKGVAIWSLISTLNAQLQGKNAGLKFSVDFDLADSSEIGRVNAIGYLPGKLLVQDTISYIQSASVDNAKDQLLGKLNLTEDTFGAASIIALAGYDIKTIGYFLNQPIIHEYLNTLKSLEAENPSKNSKTIEDKALKIIREKYKPLTSNSTYEGKIESRIQLARMRELLKKDAKKEKPARYAEDQLDMLARFLKYDEAAKELRGVQNLFSLTTKGIGRSILESSLKRDSYNKLSNMKNWKGLDRMLETIDKDTKLSEFDTIEGHAYEQGVMTANSIFKSIFSYESPAFFYMIQNLKDSGYDLYNSSDIRLIVESLRTYSYTHPDIKLWSDETPNEARKRLFFDDKLKGTKSIATRLKEAKANPKIKDSLLLKNLKPKPALRADLPIKIEYKGEGKQNPIEEAQILESIFTLYRGTVEEKELIIDLIKYSILSRGQTASFSMFKFIPFAALPEFGISEILNDIQKISYHDRNLFDNFVKQQFQHNPSRATTLKVSNLIESDKLLLEFGEQVPILHVESKKDSPDGFSKFIKHFDKISNKIRLYERDDSNIEPGVMSSAEYNAIDILGDTSNKAGMHEFDFNSSNKRSIIPENNVYQIESVELPTSTQLSFALEDEVEVKTNQYENKVASANNKLGLSDLGDGDRVGKLLRNIMNSSSVSDALKEVATEFKLHLKVPVDVRYVSFKQLKTEIDGVTGTEEALTHMTKSGVAVIYINSDKVHTSENELSRVILHEITHGFTVKIIRLMRTPEGQTELRGLLGEANFKKAQKAVTELGDILTRVRSEVRNGKVKGASEIELDTILEKLRNNEELTPHERDTYYGLSSLPEFMSEMMSSKEFQKLVGQVKSEKGKNILVELWEKLTNLFKAIFDIKNNDNIGIEAIDHIMTLLQIDQGKTIGEQDEQTYRIPSVEESERLLNRMKDNKPIC